MLQLMNDQQLIDDVVVFVDDVDPEQYYVFPQTPRYLMRRDNGMPNFAYVKYRLPIDREDGKRGGGLVYFGVELNMLPATEAKVRAWCEQRSRARRGMGAGGQVQVKLGRPTFTRGTVRIDILDSGGVLVQRVNSAGVPSLFGNNAVAVSAEFSPEGAAVFEQVMQRQGNGMINVFYTLSYYGRMPDSELVGHWDASAFMSFSQTVDVEDNFWSEDDYTENISEYISKSESRKLEWTRPLIPPAGMDPAQAEKIKATIEDSVRQQLDDGIKRNLLEAIPPESRDVSKIRDQGYENIKRTVNTSRFAAVNVVYKGASAVEAVNNPQAPLDSIGGLQVNGKTVKWEQVATVVDADDPFFKKFAVRVQVNADFVKLPIFSVDVTWSYQPPGKPAAGETYSFRKPEDIEKFDVYYDGGDGAYSYSYVVNYKGEDRVFKAPEQKTTSKVLTINVADLGIWVVDVTVGDINFDQVERVQVLLSYEDGAQVPRIERVFTLDKQQTTFGVRELIFVPRDKPYKYKFKYFMKGGREIEGPEREGRSEQLYVNDPFSATRSVSVRSKGDFDTRIDTLFLDFLYEDPDHAYRQERSFALSKAGKRFDDWSFPVIDEKAGTLTYTGQILYKNGTSSPIPKKTVVGNTVLEGEDVAELRVEIVPDLIDWGKTKLVIVQLEYADADNNIQLKQSYTLRGANDKPGPWLAPIKNAAKTDYDLSATFFMQDGTRKALGPTRSHDATLVLELPN